MEALANMPMTLFPAFAFLGIVLFACDRQDKRKIELEKVKAKQKPSGTARASVSRTM